MATNGSSGSLKPVLITAVLAVVGTLATTYLAQQWRDSSQFKFNLYDKRIQAFTELVGVRTTISQVAVSFQEIRINQEYHQAKWVLTHDLFNFEQSKRYVVRSEELVSDLSKERKRLYELIALVAVLFPRSPELEKIIGTLGQIGILEPPPSPNEIHKVSELEEWRVNQIKLARDHVDNAFDKPLGKLVVHIDAIMKKESLN